MVILFHICTLKYPSMVYCNAAMIHILCKHLDTYQPSRMFTHYCVYYRKLLSIISRAQCHWISTMVRCDPDSFQKAHVTLKVVERLLAALLQCYYTISTKKMRDKENSQLPEIHSTCPFGLWALKKC